jgi:adenine-specific DNA-methyltransferase
VLIVTIDVNELHHLGLLLEEIFPAHLKYMVNIVINPKGVSEFNFARIEEQALFCCPDVGHDVVLGNPIDFMPQDESPFADETDPEDSPEGEQLNIGGLDSDAEAVEDGDEKYEYQLIRRRGTESRREDRPSMFYPIFVDEKRRRVVRVGAAIPLGVKPSMQKAEGLRPVWPINKAGMHGRWQVGAETMQSLIDSGDIVLGAYNAKIDSWTINRRVLKKEAKKLKTVWRHKSHDAGTHGTVLLAKILGITRAFPFPKSVYVVRDCIGPVVRNRPNALILDFFAGSGTTYHATALLNADDQGRRRCLLVTNNEVAEKLTSQLSEAGIFPGQQDFEKHGIAESVTWPRCKYITQGQRDDGTPLPDRHLDGRELKDGFLENLAYFRLDFLDPAQVARGDAFQAILPILWMVAGCQGELEDSKGSQPWFFPKTAPFAVLIKEREFRLFRQKLAERSDIAWVFLITDSEENFSIMRRAIGRNIQCVQLYKSYLENFRLNTQETLA